ncbi:outer membrane protein assembly factor BamA [Pedobacter ginsengisoli]|uniref:Outer membrane protein assembly factor BamA n=2 Tax=Pedobacter ginsengisoli TaxID=363852 RepID=A0A2D1UBR0_9SPHI|nr:outer membrane protein assembly factor BamA [Pedobacter ginsengisoli]ATP59033.1 outer membrane protein assembly factor BamA [Pedobacter ginsengisoli]
MAQITRPSNTAPPTLKVKGLDLDYFNPKEYIIGGVTLTGTHFIDKEVIITLSKLIKGESIVLPGEATANAIKTLWAQGLFDDVQLDIAKIVEDTVYFDIEVVERPRLSSFEINGVSKSQKTDILEKLNEKSGKSIINDNLYNSTTATIKKFLLGKGYFFTTVEYKTKPDPSLENGMVLQVFVDKGRKVKVHEINFSGNKDFSSAKLRKFLKKTKQQAFYKVFGSGKFNKEKYDEDKVTLIAKMQDKGYRDAVILKDSIYQYSDKAIGINIEVYEGPKYYFGDISWAGNAKYTTDILEKTLGIEKGEVFSEEKLEKKLRGSANGDDVSSIYLNDGYLTFNVDPVQTKIHGDTVDVEMRIYEGPQYTNNRITLKGNTITNDRVVLREIRTKPGEKFSKDLLIRTVREIGQLGNFDESKTVPTPKPNPADGTVDIEYAVEEKPSDQIELSGGFGGGNIIGTLGLTFNNFSLKNIFNLDSYKPLPKGDGQKLSLRGQTNGKYYQSYSFSFSEPWLGGKKPISFGVSAFTSLQSNGLKAADSRFQKIRLNGVTVSLGRRLNFPDNYFQLTHAINVQQYILNNYPGYLFSTGTSYNLNLTQELSRDSRNHQIFPTEGSFFRFTVQATPPYSLLNNINYATASDKQRYKFTEYHKWKFESQWFQRLAGKFVVMAQAQFGFLGTYNSAVGESAFERFKLGGDGMQGFDFLQGSEVIKMRGYANNAVIPQGSNATIAQNSGSPIFTKYVMELRYPVIASQQATAFILAFAEGGNTWNKFGDFNPFNVRRTAGIGARIFLPIFGMLGIDYGHAFDKIPGITDGGRQNFTFSIAQQLGGL